MKLKRSSGILLHITSLPSPYGIGDLGEAAYNFIDFLNQSGHKYWQILPLNPTEGTYSHSPYSSFSAFAGNPLLVSPWQLEKEGFLNLKNFPLPNGIEDQKVNFENVRKYKEQLFEEAFSNLKNSGKQTYFQEFCKGHEAWLDDFSLYKALKKEYNQQNWSSWPEALRDRDPQALLQARERFSEEIEKQKFIQYLFFSQWKKLTQYAHEKKVAFVGDIPFYINHDSADCWANQEYFKLDVQKKPTKVSGVPPDYFSETGQLWGTPVYDWEKLKANNFDWWLQRIKQNLLLFDLVRVDHFRAFAAYWEVPAEEKTAMNGKWVDTPGIAFFKKVKAELPEMPLIAEDLGTLDESVYELLEKFDFPGMKVLHFAFGDDRKDNPYLPFNHSPNNIVYTGTHDNNTTCGWFKKLGGIEKQHLQDYVGTEIAEANIHRIMHRMALSSVAKVAIVPLQDLLGMGEEAIMNIPGTTEGNWSWRVTEQELAQLDVKELRNLNLTYGRFSISNEQ